MTHTHKCMRACMPTYIHACICKYRHTYLHSCMHTCTHARMHTHQAHAHTQLLRACCFNCRELKMANDRKAYFVHILNLVRCGKLAKAGDALAHEDGYLDHAHAHTDEEGENDDRLDVYGARDKFSRKTAHQQELWAEVVAACMAAMPQKCAHCGAVGGSLKKDG